MNRRNLILSALACLVPTGAIAADKPIPHLVYSGFTGIPVGTLTVITAGKGYPGGKSLRYSADQIYQYHKPTRTLIPIPHSKPLEDFEQ
jgi:hypothetical protein